LGFMRFSLRVATDAARHFVADDGWAIASHIALSTLMALFPFLLVLTAFAGSLGTKALADEAARLLLQTWPAEVAGPIANQIHDVLAAARGNVFTVGLVLAVYFRAAWRACASGSIARTDSQIPARGGCCGSNPSPMC
jgi:membrane protein